MAGYATRTLKIDFPELSEDPEIDPIWISIRNPKLMAPGELTPDEVKQDPVDENDPAAVAAAEAAAKESTVDAMYKIFSRLILAWRVYDATDFRVDETTGEPLEQNRLGLPATVEQIRKLPQAIIGRLSDEVFAAINPR